MNTLSFISSLAGNVLSWPVMTFCAVMLLRRPLTELLNRVKSYEGLGQKLEFGEGLSVAEEAVEGAVDSVERSRVATESRSSLWNDVEDSAAKAAGSNPSYAVLSAWEQLQKAIGRLTNIALADEEPEDPPRLRFAHTFPSELRKRGLIDAKFERAVDQLRALRNNVAHGEDDPTPGEAIAYVKTAGELQKAVQTLTAIEMARRRARGDEQPDGTGRRDQ